AVRCERRIQQTCNVGMLQLRERVSFGVELLHSCSRMNVTRNDFDSYLLLEVSIKSTRVENRPHAALTKQSLDAERSKLTADPHFAGCVSCALKRGTSILGAGSSNLCFDVLI